MTCTPIPKDAGVAMSSKGSFATEVEKDHSQYGGGSGARSPSPQSILAYAMHAKAFEDNIQLHNGFVSQDLSVNADSGDRLGL
jgi:hypothetical protein